MNTKEIYSDKKMTRYLRYNSKKKIYHLLQAKMKR